MNTDVAVDGPADLRPWFAEVEATLSRFDPASPLCRLNGLPGRWVVVPDLLWRAVGAALHAAAATDGAFDPTVLGALEAAGYNQSFELGPGPLSPARPAGRWREVKLDSNLKAIWLPPGVRLDLGGIGKGLAVDGGIAHLKGAPRALVNAGGDLAVRMTADEPPYLIDVEDPFDPDRVLATFGVRRGAVATSSMTGRRWGDGLHHIIDPKSGRPAETDLAAATVFGPGAAMAEALAKAAIVLGSEKGIRLMRDHGCHALFVRRDGSTLLTDGLEEYRHVTA
ncbi:MAG TPA: FAD:protein FMN transferase [Symbiobacteriaceae bacterium]|nr:FAD:protein FMN transferase [Symbiobacteriaceae bacterium]